jgi:hypothetical protein
VLPVEVEVAVKLPEIPPVISGARASASSIVAVRGVRMWLLLVGVVGVVKAVAVVGEEELKEVVLQLQVRVVVRPAQETIQVHVQQVKEEGVVVPAVVVVVIRNGVCFNLVT